MGLCLSVTQHSDLVELISWYEPEPLENCTSLGIHGKDIESLPHSLFTLTNLERLEVQQNRLTSLPWEISHLTALRSLCAFENCLSAIPPEPMNLTNLRMLYIQSNKISSLPAEISKLTALFTLWIHDNPIESLPPGVTALKHLLHLQIESGGCIQVKQAPIGISSLPCWNNNLIPHGGDRMTMTFANALRTLKLYTIESEERYWGHQVIKIGWAPSEHYMELKSLDISSNNITFLPEKIGLLTNLERLTIFDNPIEELPHWITRLRNLKNLQVEDPNALIFKKCSIKKAPRDITTMACWNKTLEKKIALYDVFIPEGIEFIPKDYVDVLTVNFSAQESIGRGAFGRVYKVKLNKRTVAIKVMRKKAFPGTQEYEELTREAKLMYNLDHENIIKLHGYGCQKDTVFYISEFADGKSIWDLIKESGPLKFGKYIQYSIQINAGMKYLHNRSPPIEHRDLKPENILLSGKVAKICDFGVSTSRQTEFVTNCFEGTYCYAAPEYFATARGYGTSSDIYSYGLLVWAMIAGKKPYEGLKPRLISEQKLQEVLPEIPASCSMKLARILFDCWNMHPPMRPDAAQLEIRLRDVQNEPGALVGYKSSIFSRSERTELTRLIEGK